MACQNTAPSCASNEVIVSSINSIDKKKRIDTSEDVICAVTIPSKLLLEWREKISCKTAQSYVAELNASMKIIQINLDNAERLEGRLQRLSAEVLSELKRRKKRKEAILEKAVTCTVKINEVMNLDMIEEYRYNERNYCHLKFIFS